MDSSDEYQKQVVLQKQLQLLNESYLHHVELLHTPTVRLIPLTCAVNKFNDTKEFLVYPLTLSKEFIRRYKDVLDIRFFQDEYYCSYERFIKINFSKLMNIRR